MPCGMGSHKGNGVALGFRPTLTMTLENGSNLQIRMQNVEY